ncbi:cytochrome oxidase small assembly protein [Ampullimonas aquatilis]
MTKEINREIGGSKNIRTAMILFSIAFAFFIGVMAKHIFL